MKIRLCPTCKRELPSDPGGAPPPAFCSARCRLVDLGAWLNESYRISASLSDDDQDQAIALDVEGDPNRRGN